MSNPDRRYPTLEELKQAEAVARKVLLGLQRLGKLKDPPPPTQEYLQPDGLTLAEVGQEFGFSRQAAQKAERRAMEKCRRYFEQRGITGADDLI